MLSNIRKPMTQGFVQNRPLLGASSAVRFVQSALLALRMAIYRVTCFSLSHLFIPKLLFAVLRRVRPVALFGKTLLVTKADDVREVLQRFDDFTLGDVIEPGMPWGTFIMTVDWRDQHAAERQLLQSVVVPEPDIEKIRAIVNAQCQQKLGAANGRLDVVADLFEPIVVSIAADYFGVPPLDGCERRMAQVMRDLAGIIMVNPPVGSKPWLRSRNSIADITTHVAAELSKKSASVPTATAPPADDLLTRLVKRLQADPKPGWFDENWIRHYLTGLLATGAATIVRAAAHTIDQLLAHPDALKRAQTRAAELEREEELQRRGAENRVGEARCALRHYIYEALRFRPMLPLLIRDAPRETVIAFGTKRARVVPAGTHIIAPPLAAMFDPEAVQKPWDFLPARELDCYLHFGQGARRCFGKYIAETALLEIFRSLLLLPDLARAAGSDGRIQYDGPAASSLILTFQAKPANVRTGKP
jgi:cytochrome P450